MSHKYRAQPTCVDGYRFDSKAEAHRHRELRLLEKSGLISDIKVHPVFVLQKPFVDFSGKKRLAIKYEADFSYTETGNPLPVIEDVKGVETEAFKIKAKMFMFHYPQYELRIVKV